MVSVVIGGGDGGAVQPPHRGKSGRQAPSRVSVIQMVSVVIGEGMVGQYNPLTEGSLVDRLLAE